MDRRCSFDRPIRNVAVVGGTHGNELHGIFLVRELDKSLAKGTLRSQFPSLKIRTLIANPAAVVATGTGQGRRYVEKDLNRCFLLKDLENADPDASLTLEDQKAREINSVLGPKASDSPRADFIIDLHSTTANTGVLILCHPEDLVTLSLAHTLRQKYPEVSLGVWSQSDLPLLPTVGRSGLTLEVGPIAHSTAVMRLYSLTRNVLLDMLTLLERHNTRLLQPNPSSLSSVDVVVARRFCSVGFPRDDNGEIVGFIHPSIQGIPELQSCSHVDWESPIFEMLTGDVLTLASCTGFCRIEYAPGRSRGSHFKFFPQFVNEAAYYEKDIALIMTVMESIPTLN